MTTTERTEVLIVGAGPAGLVLAAVLADHGVDFRIIDRKAGPIDQSRAAIVHVRTLELLHRLGIAERAVARGVKTTRVEIYERGRPVGGFPLAGPGAEELTRFPYALSLEQDRTERLLVEWLAERGHGVEWQTELVALADQPVVRRADGTRVTVSARWVVGADGARSSVRHALGLGFAGGTYEQTGLLADVDIELPPGADLPAGTLRLNLTRGGFVGIFGLAGGRHRIFGAVPPELAPRRVDGDISHEAYAEVPLADIQRWFDGYFGIEARLTGAAWTALFRIHSRIADRFRAGNAFLIGDAAHIHSPAGGQGMNLAIGDAFNLGWKLALVAKGQAHEVLLDSYEAERRPVAKTVLRGADRGFALETTSNPVAVWMRSHVATRMLGPLTRLKPVRMAIFALFSQTWIRYRHSPAIARSRGRFRAPRPGDRAPFGGTIGGTRHHVLLCEGSRPGRIEDLFSRYRIEVGLHIVPAGDCGPGLCLVRPDGHLAFTGSPDDDADLGRLRDYLDRLFLPRDGAM